MHSSTIGLAGVLDVPGLGVVLSHEGLVSLLLGYDPGSLVGTAGGGDGK